ncbi:MAG: hypothetical protein DCC71_22905, partial [Proteobacteria bacterium]
MADAEDVLIGAAEHVAIATRSLWTRRLVPDDARAARAGAAQRRLALWLHAAFGRAWPIVPVDTPPAPRWLARSAG